MAALLALGGAVCWGAGDFLGGLAARRMAVIAVLAISQAIGLAGVLVWVVVAQEAIPGVEELLPAAAAGVAGLVGLGALYRGLAVGAMGIVAPISAASPIVGLTADAVHGTFPAALQWLGIALVLAGIATLSREPSSDGNGSRIASGVGLALVAALGFGLFVKPVAKLTLPESFGMVQFSPLGNELAVGTTRPAAHLGFWNTTAWKPTRTLTNFGRLLYTPDGRGLWLSKDPRTAGLYDAQTFKLLLLLPTGTLPLAVSPDGRHLAVSVDAQRLQLWNLGAVREEFGRLGLDWEVR